jgi:hypothetical protein
MATNDGKFVCYLPFRPVGNANPAWLDAQRQAEPEGPQCKTYSYGARSARVVRRAGRARARAA